MRRRRIPRTISGLVLTLLAVALTAAMIAWLLVGFGPAFPRVMLIYEVLFVSLLIVLGDRRII